MNWEAMDVPTDTKMPDGCTDAPLKDPNTYECTDAPKSHDIWGTYGIGRTYRCTGRYGGHTDVQGVYNHMGVYKYTGGCTDILQHTDAP